MGKYYTKEFKQEAVKLVIEHGYSEHEAAARLGINSKNIYRWVKKENALEQGIVKTNPLTADQIELIRLRKENDRLKMEKEILKKAAAFFANEKN
jgi:transposase